MAKETIGSAWVQIKPSTDGLKESLTSAMNDAGSSAGSSAGGKIASGISGVLKGSAAAIGASVTAAAAGVTAMTKGALEAGGAFETAFAQVETIMDTTQLSSYSMSSGLIALSNKMGISAEELANTAYNAISATGDTANALKLSGTASKLAIAGFTDTSSALSVLTTAMNAYGMEASEAESISDSLIMVQNLGVTTVSELSSSMGKAIASASAYGVDLGNVESAYVSMTKAGISTAESTTYMASMMKELGDSGSDVSEILKNATGKSFDQLMTDGASLADVLGILYDSVEGDSTALMNLWGSAEAGKASNAILSQGLDEFNKNLETIEGTAGSTQTAFETMQDTMSVKLGKVQTSWDNMLAGIANGKAAGPLVASFVDNVVQAAEAMLPEIETVLNGIGDIVSKLAPVIAEKLPALISDLMPSFILTISSLIEGILAALPELLTAISAALPGLLDTVIGVLMENLPTLLTVAADAIITLADGLATYLPELIPVLIDTVLYIVDQLTQPDRLAMMIEAAIKLIVALVGGLVAAIPKIIEAIPQIIKNIVQAFKQAWPQIKQSGIELFRQLGAGLTQIMQSISKICTDIFWKIKEKFNEKKQEMIGIGQNIFNGLTQGIGNAVGAVIQKVTGVASSIVTAVKKLLGIHSPSTVFAQIGEYIDEGLVNGIEGSADLAVNAAKTMADDVTDAMSVNANMTAASASSGFGSLAGSSLAGGIGNVSIVVNAAPGQNENTIAELVSQKLAAQYSRSKAVYA